ncbi:MAG: tetratricopeptide repeat protein [Thermotogales bacterium]|nr:tetratricopeptide repeat protein [Thermotogales bacterium]
MVAIKRPIFLLFVLLSACSTAPQRSIPPVVDGTSSGEGEHAPLEPLPDRVEMPPPAPGGGAVVALLDRADNYRQAGDISNEAATIERALRIDPRNARLWHRLAAARLDQGQPQQAEQLALKSNALSAGDTRLQADNWKLVAKARWSMNDSAGARAAENRARELADRI